MNYRVAVILNLAVLLRYGRDRHTDRQTDRQTDDDSIYGASMATMASRVENCVCVCRDVSTCWATQSLWTRDL